MVSKKINFCLLACTVLSFSLEAQNKHCRIFFSDKGPEALFSQSVPPGFSEASVHRRAILDIPWTAEDWPVYEPYVHEVEKHGTALFKSRWMNMIAAELDQNAVNALSVCSFVQELTCFEPLKEPIYAVSASALNSASNDYEPSDFELLAQTAHLDAGSFRNKGLNGQGIRIAVLDIGFKDLKETEVLKDVNIIEARDFMSKKSKLYTYHAHGTQVMSCLAGKYKDFWLGLAPEASYLLARTERNGEYFVEEESWIEAAEWADQMGARIISSSLGYTWQRYWKKDMDGKTSLVSIGAAKATSKGILVVTSAGNDGDGEWRIIGAPADSDSVLSVGGIDPETGFHIGFSSFGPNTNGSLKPNVCAFGKAITGSYGGVTQSEGTSFSCPLISGFAACLIQADSTLSPYQLRKRIEASAHLFPYFDYAHGYGIPKASKALQTFDDISRESCLLSITEEELGWKLKVSLNGSEGLNMNPDQPFNHLYYHIELPKGGLKQYRVVFPFQMYMIGDTMAYREPVQESLLPEYDALMIPKKNLETGSIIRAVYRGCVVQKIIKK